MQHHLSGHVPSTREGAIIVSQSIDKHLGTAKRCLILLLGLIVLCVPLVLTIGGVWLVKPAGPLNAESNTTFWIISSIVVAASAFAGILALLLIGRHISKRIAAGVFESVATTEAGMHEELLRRIERHERPPASTEGRS